MEARFVSLLCQEEGGSAFNVSNSHGDSFDHALRRHGGNDLCESVAGSSKQGAEFRFGSFSSSGHHQHVEIEKLTERVCIGVGHNPFHQQESSIPSHRSAAIFQDPDAVVIIPIINDTTENIGIGSLRNRIEKISGYR